MRLLIAGWHGQVARALTEAAPSDPDIKALAVGRPALDVRDPRSIERAFGDIEPNIVINSAAYTAVDQAETDAEAAFKLNAEGAGLLARAAARRGVPILHLSTHYVYDGLKASPYVEGDETRPLTVYGRSKLDGEVAVMEANSQHVILRTGWVFGARGRNFATNIVQSARDGAGLSIVGDQRGSPTYAPDLARAILNVARRVVRRGDDASMWGLYHAAGTGDASWHELATLLVQYAAERGGRAAANVVAIPSSDYPTPAPRPANSVLDCRKLAATFGVQLAPWQEAAGACVDRIMSAQQAP